MSNNRNTKTPRTPGEALLVLFTETLSQQNRDLEAGVTMYLEKQGPPEERERLLARAHAARAMYRKLKSSLAAAPAVR